MLHIRNSSTLNYTMFSIAGSSLCSTWQFAYVLRAFTLLSAYLMFLFTLFLLIFLQFMLSTISECLPLYTKSYDFPYDLSAYL